MRVVLAGGASCARKAGALLAGLGLFLAHQPRPLWWLAPLAIGLFVLVIRQRRVFVGFVTGLVFGVAYLLPLISWMYDFLGPEFGPWPWLGIVAVEALFFGLTGAAVAWVSRLPLPWLWAAAVITMGELVRSSVPFGGFPWGRLAFTQPEGLFLPLAAVGGASLVSFAVALVGAGLAELVVWARWRQLGRWVPVVTPLIAGSLAWALLPMLHAAQSQPGTARVAVVQGNAPNSGVNLLHESRVIHANHIAAGNRLVSDVHSGRVLRPDVVLFPEQASSWDVIRQDPAYQRISTEVGAPLLVGGIAREASGNTANRVLRFDPVLGITGEYAKQHLVPFAETIPLRSVARMVTPFVDQFGSDMTPGTEPGVFAAGRPASRLGNQVLVGVGLCYDVAYDDVYRAATRAGANMLAVPTNNAWYGHSEMSHQHLAMARLRAVEHGRAVAVAATSGISAIVAPDGSVAQQTEQFTAQTLHADVPLRTGITPATWLGSAPSWVISALGVVGLAWASLGSARRRAHGGQCTRRVTQKQVGAAQE